VEAVATHRKQHSVGESVTRGALALLSTQPLTWSATLLTTVMLPRLLGADALGQVTIATTIATLGASASSLGISEFLVRRVAQHPSKLRHDASVALLVQLITAIVGVVLIVLATHLYMSSLVDLRVLDIALVASLITPAQTVLLSSFRGRELHKQYAWFNAACSVLSPVAAVVALLLGADLIAYVTVLSVVLVATTLAGWKVAGLRPSFQSVDRWFARDGFAFICGGLPFFGWSVVLTVTSGIDRVLLGGFVPAAEVGWYAAAFRIISIPIFIPTLVITPLFPALSRSVSKPDTIRRTIAQTVRIMLLLMVPLCAGIIVVAPAIPALFAWPDDFANAVPLMVILSLQLPVVAVDMVLGTVLMAIGRQGRWLTVGMFAAALKIALNYVAIPVFEHAVGNGAIGASVVTIATEIVMFGGAMLLIPRSLLDPRLAWDALRISIVGVAIVVVGTYLLPVALALAIAGGVLACLVAMIGLRALTLGDLHLIAARLPLPRRGA
jgi:O-antigen/teichoic acid export membrane protein